MPQSFLKFILFFDNSFTQENISSFADPPAVKGLASTTFHAFLAFFDFLDGLSVFADIFGIGFLFVTVFPTTCLVTAEPFSHLDSTSFIL